MNNTQATIHISNPSSNRSRRGFTLIEIIMAVVITGLTAMFVIPNFSKSTDRNKERIASDNLNLLISAQRLSFANSGVFKAGASATALNTALGVYVTDTSFTYSCTIAAGPPQSANCLAADTGGAYTLRSNTRFPTVCCSVGTCPTNTAVCS